MKDDQEKLTDVTANDIRASPLAFLLDDGKRKEWVPKSLVENNRDGTWTMPEWLAKEKGFI